MNRHALISRIRRRFRLARKIAAPQPFIVRTARHQRLAQAFGLPRLTEPTATVPGRVITAPGQGFDQAQRPALLPVDPAFRPPFVERAEDEYEVSPAPDNRVEIPDQLHNSEEAVEAQSQQEHADSHARPVENARAKRSPGRIQEQPAGARHITRPAPPPLSRAGVKNQEVPKEANAQAGEAGRERISADELFAARGTDRSPQAWLVRLMGTSSEVRNDAASPSTTTEEGNGKTQPPLMGSDHPVPPKTRSYPVATGPTTTTQDEQNVVVPLARARSYDPRSWEGPRPVVPPQTNDRWRLRAESRPPIAGSANVARNVLQARPAPIPLSQRTRQFLQPLVGMDLAGVRVYRDANAERLTDAYQADAITVGDDVQVATGHPDDTPETLGLLAHEFTHVARQREPHFIPPIARSEGTPLAAQSQAPLAGEALAQQVEGRVKRIAQEQIDQTSPFSVDRAAGPYEAPVRATSSVPGTTSLLDTWGGLPAPWEPLPGWLVSSPAMGETSVPAVVGSSQPSPAVFKPGGTAMVGESYGSADQGTGGIPGEVGVQRAGSERSLNMEETQTATSQPPATMAKTPEPDLDALARQVYSILKRRLGVESRREG